MPEDWEHGGFGLYVHWPFCQAKCPYCDFNSFVTAKIDQSRWLKAYVHEIERVYQLTEGRILNTVFFGGGTPSLMDPEVVDGILNTVRKVWRTSNSFEVTLEANPTSIEAGRFSAYREAGVNRISMGVQSLNDEDLKRLGRLHTAQDAKDAYDIARSTFERVSFDLIYARQHQRLVDWEAELDEALHMAIDHLSLYQLTIEDGTAFGERFKAGGLLNLPTDDTAADMFDRTQEICQKHGLPAYEVSNHAELGAESQHNLIYWRYGDYAGIGPGAHGRLTVNGTRYATETHLMPGKWLEAVEQNGTGESVNAPLSAQEQVTEYLLMGMRISEGISIDRLEALGGKLDPKKMLDLSELNLVRHEQGRLTATQKGRVLLNSVITELLPA